MSTRFRLLLRLLAAAVLVGLFSHPGPAAACSCIMPPQPSQAFNDAAAVFAGTVTSINNPSQVPLLPQLIDTWASWTHSPAAFSFYNRRVTFAVTDSWKGVTTSTVTLKTGQGDADCGYLFARGRQYVVYAYDFQGAGLETNICTRTSDAGHAAADLNYLNTLPRLPLTPASLAGWPYLAVAALVGAAVLGSAVWFIRRRAPANAAG